MTTMLLSVGLNDAVLAAGDSITLAIFGGAGVSPSYPSKINTLYPPYSAYVSNQGVGGQTSTGALSTVPGLITSNLNCSIVTLAWGTNDCFAGHVSVADYTTNMTSLVNTVLNSGRIPVIPTIPYSTDPNMANLSLYNAVITGTLYAISGVRQGPDLYTLIFNTPTYLGADGIHFTNAGYIAAIAEWANAMSWVYA